MSKGGIYFIQSPYQRQILQVQKNNDYTDILKNSIIELEEGMIVGC